VFHIPFNALLGYISGQQPLKGCNKGW